MNRIVRIKLFRDHATVDDHHSGVRERFADTFVDDLDKFTVKSVTGNAHDLHLHVVDVVKDRVEFFTRSFDNHHMHSSDVSGLGTNADCDSRVG